MEQQNSSDAAPSRSPIVADLMILVAVLGWAVSFPVAAMALNDWDAKGYIVPDLVRGLVEFLGPTAPWKDHKFAFLAGRFWLVFLLFLPVAIRYHGFREIKRHLRPGLVVGATLVVTYAFQFEALRTGGAGEVAFITSFSSVLVPPLMWVMTRERVPVATLLGLVIATLGVLLMSVTETLTFSMGAVLAIGGAIGVALDTILIARYRQMENADGSERYATLPFLVTQFFSVAIGTSALCLAWEIPTYGAPAWSGSAIFGMVFMAVVATGIAFYLQTRFQRFTTPDRAALIFTIEPAAAAMFSFMLIGEALTLQTAIGGLLILIGVGGSEFLAARREMAASRDDSSNADPHLESARADVTTAGPQEAKPSERVAVEGQS